MGLLIMMVLKQPLTITHAERCVCKVICKLDFGFVNLQPPSIEPQCGVVIKFKMLIILERFAKK